MGISKKWISILGDTLTGYVSKEEALETFLLFCKDNDYIIDEVFFASEQKLQNDSILKDGDNEYLNTKIFTINENIKIVGIKSDGSTSYFYQDVALIEKLGQDKKIGYLTGTEQISHFKNLNEIYPNIKHVPLGLILIDGKKSSSSLGNVIFIKDIYEELFKIFLDEKLIYNIIAGNILTSEIDSLKNIFSKDITYSNSPGLYISYTMARMINSGIEYSLNKEYFDFEYDFYSLKGFNNLQPKELFNYIIKKCNLINSLYNKYKIKGNSENKKMFQDLSNDLFLAVNELGLNLINKI